MLITDLWNNQPGVYFCISTKSPTGKWSDHFFRRREFRKVQRFLEDHRSSDLYFCPHGFSKPRRIADYAVLPRLLWSDMDEADPKKAKIKPSVAIESSPGRYVGLWVLDAPMNIELNRRLSYFLGADPSGWDLTQVLRCPGTTNYKYSSTPKTRLLWRDGPAFKLRALDKELPQLEADNPNVEGDRASVFKKWRKKMPHWVQRELVSKVTPPPGKRSEMLWKLNNALFEIGVPVEDILLLVKGSVWNKFAGRYSEDKQLRRELDKIINHQVKPAASVVGEDDDDEDSDGKTLLAKPLSEVESQNIDWIWYPYIARGEVSIIEGDPEAGKSYISQMIAARISQGEKLPIDPRMKGTFPKVKGTVVYFDFENSAATVTKKRMTWNGYGGKTLNNFYQEEQPFSIDDDEFLARLYASLERLNPTLIVFDTLNSYIGKANTAAGAESQQAFGKFVELARRFNCGVLVIRHLTKGSRDKAMYRGQGNIAFVGMARVVMLVGKHPEDSDLRVMVRTKGNLTRAPDALTYRIEDIGTPGDPDASKLVFEGYVALDPESLNAASVAQDTGELDSAVEWLRETLGDNGELKSRVERMAESKAITEQTLRRAMQRLKVVRRRVMECGVKDWRLSLTDED